MLQISIYHRSRIIILVARMGGGLFQCFIKFVRLLMIMLNTKFQLVVEKASVDLAA